MIVGWILAGVVGLAGLLFAVSAIGAVVIQRRYPPVGHFVEAGCLSIHVVEEGGSAAHGLPVLVIHGASSNLGDPRCALAGRLSGRRVVFMDRPGHGHSTRGGRAMAAPAAQAGIAAAVLEALGIERAIVVGHSWGGAVAAAMAVLHPDRVAGLVFVAPATHPWPGDVAWYHRLATVPLLGPLFGWILPLPAGLAAIGPSVRSVFAPEPVPEGYVRRCGIPLVLRPWAFRANSLDMADFKANVVAMAPRYREITAHAVVLTGDADGVVASWIHSEGLFGAIRDARLVTIAGAGHMLHHRHSEAVVAAVDDVARRAEAGRDRMPTDAAQNPADQIPD